MKTELLKLRKYILSHQRQHQKLYKQYSAKARKAQSGGDSIVVEFYRDKRDEADWISQDYDNIINCLDNIIETGKI